MRQKGLIVIGYQGIGKSSCAGKDCIDLESSCFKINNERHEDWAIIYTRIAMHIANQGYVVFTSSHKCVVDIFKTMPLMENVGKVCIFCPQRSMRNEWIERLSKRYNETLLAKDWAALGNAIERYEENIIELVNSGLPVYQPAAMDYDLRNYISKMQHDWCSYGERRESE